MADGIEITEPVQIRWYTPGGKGGYGYSTTPIHRLVLRTAKADHAACGATRGSHSKDVVKNGNPYTAGRRGLPLAAEICQKCWPQTLAQRGAMGHRGDDDYTTCDNPKHWEVLPRA